MSLAEITKTRGKTALLAFYVWFVLHFIEMHHCMLIILVFHCVFLPYKMEVFDFHYLYCTIIHLEAPSPTQRHTRTYIYIRFVLGFFLNSTSLNPKLQLVQEAPINIQKEASDIIFTFGKFRVKAVRSFLRSFLLLYQCAKTTIYQKKCVKTLTNNRRGCSRKVSAREMHQSFRKTIHLQLENQRVGWFVFLGVFKSFLGVFFS